MDLLTKYAILKAEDLKTERVDVPEWGGTVIVRTMTGLQLDGFFSAVAGKEKDKKLFHTVLCAATLVDEAGKPLFTFGEVAKLAMKSGSAIRRIAQVAMRLNGLDVEEVEGNSESAPTS